MGKMNVKIRELQLLAGLSKLFPQINTSNVEIDCDKEVDGPKTSYIINTEKDGKRLLVFNTYSNKDDNGRADGEYYDTWAGTLQKFQIIRVHGDIYLLIIEDNDIKDLRRKIHFLKPQESGYYQIVDVISHGFYKIDLDSEFEIEILSRKELEFGLSLNVRKPGQR